MCALIMKNFVKLKLKINVKLIKIHEKQHVEIYVIFMPTF